MAAHFSGVVHLDVVYGLISVLLTTYTSVLSYSIRVYSRAALVERLAEEQRNRWRERLDRFEPQLQGLASIVRLAAITGLTMWIFTSPTMAALFRLDPTHLAAPAITIFAALLLFGVALPNAIATHAAEGVLVRNLWMLWGLHIVLWPLGQILAGVDFVVRRLLGKATVESPAAEAERVEQDILEAVSEGELTGAVDPEQKDIIASVLSLRGTTVSAIITPRTDVVAIPADSTYEQVRKLVVSQGHSRLPVYETSKDHIVGVLYAKDLLRVEPGQPFELRKLMRPPLYVPETKTIDDLLNDFRARKVQIAIVLDEYGGTAGLCTIEDILEELVGEIDDEYDQPEAPPMQRLDASTVEVDARVHVSEVNQELGVSIPEDGDYETIGGFVFSTLGRIPLKGEAFDHENLHFQILDAEPRKINRMKIAMTAEAEAE